MEFEAIHVSLGSLGTLFIATVMAWFRFRMLEQGVREKEQEMARWQGEIGARLEAHEKRDEDAIDRLEKAHTETNRTLASMARDLNQVCGYIKKEAEHK